MINFNEPPFVGTEFVYLEQAIRNKKICGDGVFTKRCNAWLEDCTGAQKALLTTSGTAALEMAALLCDIEPGDEVILPSYTFSSTATAFVLAGARLVFVDIRPDTMNIDERMIEAAVSDKTKAIVVVHYAGVSCEMDAIMDLASEYNLRIVEDAAQGIMSLYKGRPLGSIGDFGCYSFHETKYYPMGEGGALLIADEKHNEPAEVLREKGTNRSRFFRGQVDKYTWVGYGSSYLPSDLNAAYLWAQLERADDINENRLAIWNRYYHAFVDLADQEIISLPVVPKECVHNAHMFYMKCRGLSERTALIAYLRDRDVQSTFHYIPLHSAPAGRKFGRFAGDDVYTTAESERIVRLPMYYGLAEEDQDRVIEAVRAFFASSLTSKRKE